jgi:NTP pyrophosphatase (non-canonical NTP hydrolase)
MYYIYHIPGKKIGVTRNLNNRVTLIQGYKEGEYEVLDQSEDIDYISDKEIELQQSYGYKIDRKKYNQLVKLNKFRMNINVTEQTTTFPYPVKKLKGHLMENIGMEWETDHGLFVLNIDSIRWIERNVKTSMYNNNRCYVYNKAFAEWFKKPELFGEDSYCEKKPLKMFQNIRDWAEERGLYDKGDTHTQYVKLQEEAGELAKALLEDNQEEVIDAIGDIVVVLTNLAHLRGVHIETCIAEAYSVIVNRKGKMINGTFVKDE